MRTFLKSIVVATALAAALLVTVDTQMPFGIGLVPQAHAIIGLPFTPLSFAGVARRTAYRSVAWSSAAAANSAAAAQSAAAQQQAAAAQQQAAAAQRQAEASTSVPATPPSAAAAAGQPLPLGSVVNSLPAGCVSTPVGGIDYFYCGGNFYRAAFQGNNLVYMTTKP